MAEVRETPGQKIAKPFKRAGRSVRNYLQKAAESPAMLIDQKTISSENNPEIKKINGEPKYGKTHEELNSVARVQKELDAHTEVSLLRPVSELREQSEALFVRAKQESENAITKRRQSRSLKIASWVEKAQDAVLNAKFKIPRTDVEVPIGKIAPPIVLGGLFGLPFLVPESAQWVTPALGILGGLTSGETITKIRESKFFKQRREQKVLEKLKKSEEITTDSLALYFEEFSEIVEPSDVRNLLRVDAGEGKFADLVRVAESKTRKENSNLKSRKARDNWETHEREKTVQLVMEAQLKAQVARGQKRSMHVEAVSRTGDLVTGLIVIGTPSFLIPAAGLLDDVINGINVGVTLGSTMARQFIKPGEKKP